MANNCLNFTPLTLSISYLSSSVIAAAVNSPSNYLPHPHIVFLFTFLLFCTPAFLLAHHHLHIYHSSVNWRNCNYFATMAYLLPYLLTPLFKPRGVDISLPDMLFKPRGMDISLPDLMIHTLTLENC